VSLKVSLSSDERERLLKEVRKHLPAFLHRSTTEQEDPAGDARALLDLPAEELERVVGVHLCLDAAVLAFGRALTEGLRHPFAGGAPTPVIRQDVRGPIDWAGTAKHRARAPGETSTFVVREQQLIHDTPENQALVWLLDQLDAAIDAGVHWNSEEPESKIDLSWSKKIDLLRAQVSAARRVAWLRTIRARRPTVAVLSSLRAARIGFYAERVAPAVASVLHLTDSSPEVVAEVLAERYFRPDDDGRLFEVAIALRLARAFAERSPRRRRSRLLVGEGKSSFARYSFNGNVEVRLAYQAWPDNEPLMRQALAKRHGLNPGRPRPDIMVVRSGPDPDVVILELKASVDAGYLRGGLDELLAYLADRPGLWGPLPAGWLVAPSSDAFREEVADPCCPLWILSADHVAATAVERFLPRM
jgi:hypothetical protein